MTNHRDKPGDRTRPPASSAAGTKARVAGHADPEVATSRAELRAVDVEVGTKSILSGVDLAIESGELVVLVGPNGAGKSTVLRTLVGRIQPNAGQALLDGRDVRRYSGPDRAARVAWLPQMTEVREPIRVLDLVVAARFRFRESHLASESAARRALEALGIADLAERRWPGLSGGERQRIALAGLWAQEAPLLLLDEPANHLDPTHQIDTYRWIARLARKGHGVLCVTHDVDLIGWLADPGSIDSLPLPAHPLRVVGIREGRIHFDLPWSGDEIRDALTDLFGVPFEPVEIGGRRRLLVSPRAGGATFPEPGLRPARHEGDRGSTEERPPR